MNYEFFYFLLLFNAIKLLLPKLIQENINI